MKILSLLIVCSNPDYIGMSAKSEIIDFMRLYKLELNKLKHVDMLTVSCLEMFYVVRLEVS